MAKARYLVLRPRGGSKADAARQTALRKVTGEDERFWYVEIAGVSHPLSFPKFAWEIAADKTGGKYSAGRAATKKVLGNPRPKLKWRRGVVAIGRMESGQWYAVELDSGGGQYGYDWPTTIGHFPPASRPKQLIVSQARVADGAARRFFKINTGKWSVPMPLRENFWPPDGLIIFSPNPHKGKRMTRNAPLKGVRPIGSNMTEAVHGDLTVLYSYNTPVAFLSSQGGYRTSFKHSVTTSKHIRKFFDMHGYDFKGAFQLSQGDLEEAVEYGRVKSARNPRRKLRLVPRSRKAQKRHADRLQRKARRRRAASNPLAIYGAVNPPRRSNGVTRSVKDLGRVVEIRYRRNDDKGFYYHRFKTRPRLLALSDGTLAVRP